MADGHFTPQNIYSPDELELIACALRGERYVSTDLDEGDEQTSGADSPVSDEVENVVSLDEVRASRDGRKPTRISASLIRDLMTGRPIDLNDGSGPMPRVLPSGLLIQGVTLDDLLDLGVQPGSSGTALPWLSLRDCILREGLNLTNSHITGLVLDGSKLPVLVAAGAVIDNALMANGIGPLEGDTVCEVWLQSAKINGDLELAGAKIKAGQNYALNLQFCEIAGALFMFDTEIQGTAWLFGLSVKHTLRAENLKCLKSADNGACSLAMNGARVGADLNLDGAQIEGPLVAPQIHVAGNFTANTAKIEGGVHIRQAEIGEVVSFESSELGATATYSLDATMARIDGACLLNGQKDKPFKAKSTLRLYGLRVRGNLEISECTLGTEGPEAAVAVNLAEIGGYLLAYNLSCTGDFVVRESKLHGKLDIRNCKPPENTPSTPLDLDLPPDKRPEIYFSLYGTMVSGLVYIEDCQFGTANIQSCDFKLNAVFISTTFAGKVSAQSIKVGGQLFFDKVKFDRYLHLESAILAQNLIFSACVVSKGASLDGLQLGGSLSLGARTVAEGKTATLSRMSNTLFLNDARIGGTIRTGEFVGVLSMNRTTAAAYDDGNECGRGQLLDLNGFVYDRLEADDLANYMAAPDEEDDPTYQPKRGRPANQSTARQIVRKRLGWLAQQEGYRLNWIEPSPSAGTDKPSLATRLMKPFLAPLNMLGRLSNRITGAPDIYVKRDNYAPQPFVQLASALRRTGYERQADNILSAKLWLEARHREPLPRLIYCLFGMTYNFGYSAPRAICVLLLYAALGWFGVDFANKGGLLSLDTQAVATMNRDKRAVLGNIADGQDGQERLPCNKAILPLFYAVDLMVPLLDLHQEGKCEISSPGADSHLVFYAGHQYAVAEVQRHLVPPINAGLRLTRFRAKPLNTNIVASGGMKVRIPMEDAAFIGQFLRTAYAIIGWLVVSLSILTFSGLLRQKE